MIKKIFILALLLGFVMSIGAQAELAKYAPPKLLKALTGNEPLPNVPFYPYQPGTITDMEVVGTTVYDYQTNGSSGNRVVALSAFWMASLMMWPKHTFTWPVISKKCLSVIKKHDNVISPITSSCIIL